MSNAIDWSPTMLKFIQQRWSTMGASKIAKKLGVSLPTLYKKKHELDSLEEKKRELVESVPAPVGSTAVTNIGDNAPADMELVAMRPEDMQVAQSRLGEWFRRKIELVRQDVHDAERNLAIATQNGFKADSFVRARRSAELRVQYYEKCLAAVDAGFAIVPNFPVDVIAIRVVRESPKFRTERSSDKNMAVDVEKSALAPVGLGRYVNPQPTQSTHVHERKPIDGGGERITYSHAVRDYVDEIEFPASIAQPAVMEATRAAMMLNIFDEIGCLPARKKPDPLMIGRIFKPNDKYRDNPMCFLIAWWIDTRTF